MGAKSNSLGWRCAFGAHHGFGDLSPSQIFGAKSPRVLTLGKATMLMGKP